MFLTEYDEEKQRIIEEKEREEELRERWEAGEENGIRKGYQKGSFETIYILVQDGDIPVELGAKKLNMSVEEFLEKAKQIEYQKKL